MKIPNISIDLYKSPLSIEASPINKELLSHLTDQTPLTRVSHQIKFFYRGDALCCEDKMAFDYFHSSENGCYQDTWGIHPSLIEFANTQDAYWEFYTEDFIELTKIKPFLLGTDPDWSNVKPQTRNM